MSDEIMADEEFVPSEAEQNQVTEADRAEDAKEATEAESEPTL